jgi:hypothetical protein
MTLVSKTECRSGGGSLSRLLSFLVFLYNVGCITMVVNHYRLDGINTENPEYAVVMTQLDICGCQ